jgi:hypothetical protein
MASVFFSYSHADEGLRDQLEKQLSLLKRQGIIETWHDRRIGAGQDFAKAIDHHVETDEIILLLVSADFLDSDYCYDKEMMRAMQRHEAGDAIVIPVILRACDWHGAPFGKLNATPPDGKPVTLFPDRDQALLEVAKAVRAASQRLSSKPTSKAARSPRTPPRGPSLATSPSSQATRPRSSNMRIAKEFTERDKDAFRVETFEFVASFFENSLDELAARNSGVEGTFRRIDGNRFTAKVYKSGKTIAQCTIFMGGRMFADGIAFSHSETSESNSYNECMTVEADDQQLYMRPMGLSLSRTGGDETAKLSSEGVAEHYWAMLIERLQSR